VVSAAGGAWAPLAILGTSFVTALVVFLLREEQVRVRTALNLGAAVLKLLLVAWVAFGVLHEQAYQVRVSLTPELAFVLRVDALSLLFMGLSAVLWLITTVYAVGYLEGSANRSRFFGFFSLCVSSTMGIALAANLFTFLVFYELLTLTTYPLVVHRQTAAALRAGRVYLAYTLTGGGVLLLGVVWLYALTGTVDFTSRAALAPYLAGHRVQLWVLFALLIGGLGVKSALVPLHGWLPMAMVAPGASAGSGPPRRPWSARWRWPGSGPAWASAWRFRRPRRWGSSGRRRGRSRWAQSRCTASSAGRCGASARHRSPPATCCCSRRGWGGRWPCRRASCAGACSRWTSGGAGVASRPGAG
jgi:hypothetical protein